tara:strand:- start:266 stop:748 length:483 start_codon:yes stop_codon:yes gene_type:complete
MKKVKNTKAYINSHFDYENLYLTNEEKLNQLLSDYKEDGDTWEPEYITDIDEGKFQMIYWNDEGPESMSFDSKGEYVKEAIEGFWGEDCFIEKFGIEDLVDSDWKNFDKHRDDNLDMYFEELNILNNNSYPDGDSANGVVLLVEGELISGAWNKELVSGI